MRARLATALDRVFPGIGLRATALSVLATVCLLVYFTASRRKRIPRAAVDLLESLSGLEVPGFHAQLYAHLVAFVVLLVIPAVACRIGMGLRLRDLGFRLRGTAREWLIVGGLWMAFVPVVWQFSQSAAFQRTYPHVHAVESDTALFITYELAYLLKWTAWEFFFRGFMLFGFETDFGTKAVLLSTVPFAIMHINKPVPEMMASVFAGLLLCWIARENRSIWPGVFLHSAVAGTMDFFASTFWH